MVDKKKLLKIGVHAAYLFVIYIIQAGVLSWCPLFGLVPLLLPVAVAGIAMEEGTVTGGVCGIFGGMLCDVAFNSPTIVYTITLTAVGLGIGYLTETVLSRSFFSYIVVNALGLLVVSLIQGFSLLFFRGQAVMPVLLAVFVQIIYSLVFSIPLFFAAKAIGKRSLKA